MAAADVPVTTAIRALRAAGVSFVPHVVKWVEHGGATHSASELGVPPERVIKTIVLLTDAGDPLLVLMRADREVSTKALARHLGVKAVRLCPAEVAHRHTGYVFGGTSPFGTRKPLPVYLQRSLADHESVIINGGKRGLLVELRTADLIAVLKPTLVDVATD